MTALTDISKALGTMPPVEKGKRRFVLVGESAMRALQADMDPPDKPTSIGNASIGQFPIVETTEFKGWEIVDKPVAA